MAGRVGPRIALISAILTLVAGAVGFVVVLVLGAFVLDEFDAYGEVPIPGSGRLHLPAGEVTINFHTLVTGSGHGNFPIPPLTLGITPPDWLLWVFGGLFVAGVAELTFALSWRVRSGKKAQPLRAPVSLDEPSWPGLLPPPLVTYEPSDQGVRLQQLKTLASLRDSGALTEAEFEAEKRRILGG